ncbi:hypothetical protein AAVH_08289 [Aphelenchoides avenae]|nr:hypothetical protein AAVH_08289 [Aphelenchus avenae]
MAWEVHWDYLHSAHCVLKIVHIFLALLVLCLQEYLTYAFTNGKFDDDKSTTTGHLHRSNLFLHLSGQIIRLVIAIHVARIGVNLAKKGSGRINVVYAVLCIILLLLTIALLVASTVVVSNEPLPKGDHIVGYLIAATVLAFVKLLLLVVDLVVSCCQKRDDRIASAQIVPAIKDE